MGFLLHVLDESQDDYMHLRSRFYTSENFSRLLDTLWQSKKGHQHFKDWFRPIAIEMTCESIDAEMRSAKAHLALPIKDVSLDFLKNWNSNELMNPVTQLTPSLSKVLNAATLKSCSTVAIMCRARPRVRVDLLKMFSCHHL